MRTCAGPMRANACPVRIVAPTLNPTNQSSGARCPWRDCRPPAFAEEGSVKSMAGHPPARTVGFGLAQTAGRVCFLFTPYDKKQAGLIPGNGIRPAFLLCRRAGAPVLLCRPQAYLLDTRPVPCQTQNTLQQAETRPVWVQAESYMHFLARIFPTSFRIFSECSKSLRQNSL